MADLPVADALIAPTVTEQQFKNALKVLIENVASKDWVNLNPLFKALSFTTGSVDSVLTEGFYNIANASLANITDLPISQPGSLIIFGTGALRYQLFKPVNSTNFYFRSGNGGSGSFAYLSWQRFALGSEIDSILANPLVIPAVLANNADLNNLNTGLAYIASSGVAATVLNLPAATAPVLGTIVTYRQGAVAYQRFIRYTSTTSEQWQRTGNGGSSTFAWNAWEKVLGRAEFDSNNTTLAASIAAVNAAKPDLNLFKNVGLTAAGAYLYEATVADESNFPTITMDTSKLSSVFYDHDVDGSYFKIGNSVTFAAEIYSDATGSSSGDITIQALDSAGAILTSSATVRGTTANTWTPLTVSLLLPANTAKVRTRFIRRTGNTVVKFRKARVSSDTIYGSMINPTASSSSSALAQAFYVSKAGSDTNAGTPGAPFLTIQKAVNSLAGGGIIEVAGGDYRETVTITSSGNVWLRSKRGERARIFGSDQLVVTKTSGFTQVYQAALAAKPVGMGAPRGLPVIFEWGTPSKPILDDDRHFLQRGRVYRLPYTEMFEAATKADLDTVDGRGKWFWESGIIYFAATDGSDATAKRYEGRVRPVLSHANGSIHLTRIDGYFSNSYGFDLNGIYTKREDCRVFGSYHNGFSDNANITESYRDEAGGNGNDGFNGTVTVYTGDDETTRLEATYFDPYGHDNGDDGLSYHVRGGVTIYGGLMEYNTKADVVHVTGANCVCYNTVAQGTTNGFYSATASLDARVKTVMRCVGTRARKNTYSYRAADDSVLNCENVVAESPASGGFGYYQTGTGSLNAKNCKYTGDAARIKSGNVIITNEAALT